MTPTPFKTFCLGQRVPADTPLPLNADRLAALCELAGIKPDTRIRRGAEMVLLDGFSVNGAARWLEIRPIAVHAALNRISVTQALIVKATT